MIWLYSGFVALVLVFLALDLGVLNRKAHAVSMRGALAMTGVCVVLALATMAFVYWAYDTHLFGLGLALDPEKTVGMDPNDERVTGLTGKAAAAKFLTGWILEYSLSVDNIFVISLIFAYFKIPTAYQHRVLFWGIMGALVMRGIMIAAGTELVKQYAWLEVVMGAFLVWTAWKMYRAEDGGFDAESSRVLRWARTHLPLTPNYHGQKFFAMENGSRMVTPLFPALMVVETTDVVFAVDSIPAILGVTQERFIVFTSNMMAILGLRSLYFVLAGLLDRFRYLKFSLIVILSYIGVKMLVSYFKHEWKPNEYVSLAIVGGMLLTGVVASLAIKPKAGADSDKAAGDEGKDH